MCGNQVWWTLLFWFWKFCSFLFSFKIGQIFLSDVKYNFSSFGSAQFSNYNTDQTILSHYLNYMYIVNECGNIVLDSSIILSLSLSLIEW